jgi:hypothetical protein
VTARKAKSRQFEWKNFAYAPLMGDVAHSHRQTASLETGVHRQDPRDDRPWTPPVGRPHLSHVREEAEKQEARKAALMRVPRTAPRGLIVVDG